MPNPYSQADFDATDAFYRVHNNGEQTHVVVLQADADEYAAVAYDVDPTEGGDPVAAACVAYGADKKAVLADAREWMTAHPKGVLQATGDGEKSSGGEGWTAKIVRMLKGLDDYGNDLIKQDQGGGQP